MQEEIFGPILPVVAYDDIDEALAELNRRDKPLALYVYSDDAVLIEKVIAGTSSGSVCTNHNAVQLGVPGLPFGGVGASGMGAYHGRAGFDTFSHTKSVLRRPQHGEVPLVYPPYSELQEVGPAQGAGGRPVRRPGRWPRPAVLESWVARQHGRSPMRSGATRPTRPGGPDGAAR